MQDDIDGPADAAAPPFVPPDDPPAPDPGEPALFIGAGDIAKCSALGLAGLVKDPHDQTSDLIMAYPSSTPVFTLGDNVYSDGTSLEFATCFDKSWGRFKNRTFPVPGNHDYNTSGAEGYYDYFGSRAGDASKGYYTHDVGDWRVIVLNSNCGDVPCDEDSAQLVWLRDQLANNAKPCTMAMWHHPRFSSDRAGTNPSVRPFYQALYDGDADLVLVGHAHNYERFAPIDPDGNIDQVRGIRQLVVGTGGADLRKKETEAPSSEIFFETFGIVELKLYADRYEWKLISTDGGTSDSGLEFCH